MTDRFYIQHTETGFWLTDASTSSWSLYHLARAHYDTRATAEAVRDRLVERDADLRGELQIVRGQA